MRLSELKNAGRMPTLPLSIELADAAGPGQLQLLSLEHSSVSSRVLHICRENI